MDYTILLRENKDLIITKSIPIYKGEKNYNKFRFLFPQEYSDMLPILQVILADEKTGKITECSFLNEEYKNKKVIEVPISEEITAYAGQIKLWFTLFGSRQSSTIKTSILNVNIEDHEGFSGVNPDSDISSDVSAHILELKAEIELLKSTKADNIKIDNDSNELILISNGETIAKATLPEDVDWFGWK